jgi:lysophospholipase L1-like esterase
MLCRLQIAHSRPADCGNVKQPADEGVTMESFPDKAEAKRGSLSILLKGALRWIGKLWNVAGLLIVYWLCLNAGSGLILTIAERATASPRNLVEMSREQPFWMTSYLRSFDQVRAVWYPFCYWKLAPMSSAYINVDAEGNRRTWNKDWGRHPNMPSPVRVFMFGGSTMWGNRVRDDYTVPSLLAKSLAEETNYRVDVINYGQIGYVSTQEVISLYELLRDGQRPDVVVFYDGINDSLSAYQNQIAGISLDEFKRVQEFNLLNPRFRTTLYTRAIEGMVADSSFLRLVNFLRSRDYAVGPTPNAVARKTVAYMEPHEEHTNPETLENRAVVIYLFNKHLVESWGKQFGFRTLFYWQPVIYNKKKLTSEEKLYLEQSYLSDQDIRKVVLGIYCQVDQLSTTEHIRNLSGILNDRSESLFSDMVHLNESGNRIVAEAMSRDLIAPLADIESRRTGTEHR